MKLNEELAEWVADLRKMWSGKIGGSLSHLKRFLYAFVGACTFFFFLFVLRLRELLIAEKEAVERRDLISELLADPLGFFVVFVRLDDHSLDLGRLACELARTPL